VDASSQLKQYMDIAWRRKWWVAVPIVIGLGVSLYLAKTLPRIYKATASVLTMRQGVPGGLVEPTAAMMINERLKSVRYQVMSRSSLEQVALEIGFAPAGSDAARIDRACQLLQEKVHIGWDEEMNVVKIEATDRQPTRAAEIANRMAELFVERNTQMRVEQTQGAVDTVEKWLEQTEAELRQRDEEIARYKARHIDELPEQQPAALSLLQSAQGRVQQIASEIQSRKDELSIARTEERRRRAGAEALGVASTDDDPNVQVLRQLDRELQELLANYTEANPVVRRKRSQIEQFKAAHPELVALKSEGGAAAITTPEILRIEADIRGLEASLQREQSNVDTLRRRIASMPLRSQELTSLTRDYGVLRSRYDQTLSQQNRAERAQDLELAHQGEQFRLQDQAVPPKVPFSPNVPNLLTSGFLFGLVAGLALAAGLEVLDQTIRSEEDFVSRFPALPLLGSIPGLDEDTARSKGAPRKKWGRDAAASAGLIATALSLWSSTAGGPFA
jgi:polysaccharide chain length determinant protein (PEP-CTERM system associated)